MNSQYQEMTNEYLRVSNLSWFKLGFEEKKLTSLHQNQNTEPITGVSSEGYKGKGMVQSKPRKGGIPSDDDE